MKTDVVDVEEAANDERNFVDDPNLMRKELRSAKLLEELAKKNNSTNMFLKFQIGIRQNLRIKY